jgi:hypothetical protein
MNYVSYSYPYIDPNIDVNIDVRLKEGAQINILEVIQILQLNDWSLIDHNDKITYRNPSSHDPTAADWVQTNASEEASIIKLLEQKQALNEIVGITVTYTKANIAMDLCIYPNLGYFLLLLTCDKRCSPEAVINFTWYNGKLAPLFNAFKEKINEIAFYQYNSEYDEKLFYEVKLPEYFDRFLRVANNDDFEKFLLDLDPRFESDYYECVENWSEPVPFISKINTFSHFVRNLIKKQDLTTLKPIFDTIEYLLTNGNPRNQEAIHTCFLENIVYSLGHDPKQEYYDSFIPLLGPVSLESCKASEGHTSPISPFWIAVQKLGKLNKN